ncbi:hypothetical protein [Sphingomonas sp. KC8]|uniref:hypothetical protein n=1 Tax=Sphingomonas sp. KC8 TaxID=1030157 RepID=UPI000248A43E|nr:hypothetical protein [Sphingomonas sp. KC8]ARS27604.1 hypothetical protein KC8_09900 [Sphingomonas sp. KC8]
MTDNEVQDVLRAAAKDAASARNTAWPPRDWRMLVALCFLGGGGIAMTILAWRITTLTADKSASPWPLAYALYGVLGLIAVVLTGFSYVLGKRAWSFKAGAIEGSTSGGDEIEGVVQ